MVNSCWYDIEESGRRLMRVIKDMETKAKKTKDPQLEESYLRTMATFVKLIQPYQEQMVGMKRFLRKNETLSKQISN